MQTRHFERSAIAAREGEGDTFALDVRMTQTGAKLSIIWRKSIGKADHVHFVSSKASEEACSDDTCSAHDK